MFSVFLSSYRNTSGGLGEQEMLWEYEPQASVSTQLFRVLPNFHVLLNTLNFLVRLINMQVFSPNFQFENFA